ncbi:MAG: hypothetical protein J7L86_07970 [Candidatus Marinimicrobia bacterium]|nr:hypothetical protein [Candidatus Neomarinimicrobiota bacterium]
MMQTKIAVTIIFLSILLSTCSFDPISMPEDDNSDIIFNIGEEKYIPVNPVWGGSAWNFNNPTDIFISQDDYIFVADSGNARIVVMAKTGEIVESDNFGNDFTDIGNIPNVDNPEVPINPVGLCVDSKLNVFIVDNSKNIYVWNQYINNIRNMYPEGTDSIATEITYINYDTNDEKVLTPSEFYLSEIYEYEGYVIKDVQFISDPAMLDSIYKPHIFYTEFNEEGAEFVSVAAAPFGDNQLYVCDRVQQRIASIYTGRSSYIKLRNGNTLWQHRGYFDYNVVTAGTGAGTVNNPKGITVDQSGNIYYTQLGENFSFHKITYVSSVGQWVSSFALDKNEIMDLYRFDQLYDVATSSDGDIFVVDKGTNEVQVYDNSGSFIRKAGTRFVQIDTTLYDTTFIQIDSTFIDTVITEKDTIITTEHSDVLMDPKSIAVDEEMVYIVDSGNNRILRYQLSTGIDIDLDEELGQ